MKTTDMQGKTVLVTGATGGIGKITACELARMGARVLLVGRSERKASCIADQIRTETGNPQVEYLLADLFEVAQVRRLAAEVRRRTSRLDVLVNNAGALFSRRVETAEGMERTFALNHMSYFTLTTELLDLLQASAPARVVNVSSTAHFGGWLNLDDLQLKRGFVGWRAYANSKLMNVLFTYELARRLENSGVTANALHPGVVATNFGLTDNSLSSKLWSIGRGLFLTPEQGARTSIFLAASPVVAGQTGRYWSGLRAVPSAPASYNQNLAAALWEISLELADHHGLGSRI